MASLRSLIRRWEALLQLFSNAVSTSIWELRIGEWSACKRNLNLQDSFYDSLLLGAHGVCAVLAGCETTAPHCMRLMCEQTLPPTGGPLGFPSLAWSADNDFWFGSPSTFTDVTWTFTDDGTGVVRYAVCVGMEVSDCAFYAKNVTGSWANSSIPFEPSSAVQAAQTSVMYFVTVTATDVAGLALSRTSRVMIDWSPPEARHTNCHPPTTPTHPATQQLNPARRPHT